MPKQGSALAQQFREHQAALDDSLQRSIAILWDRWFQIGAARKSWAAMRPQIVRVIVTGYRASSADGARYYSAARVQAGLPAQLPQLAPDINEDWIGRVIDPCGLGQFLKMVKAGEKMIDASDGGRNVLCSASGRLALSGGRHTVTRASVADTASAGWRRVTGGTCDYCEALAQAGVFATSFDFSAHADCLCTAEPEFSGGFSIGDALKSFEDAEDPGAGASTGASDAAAFLRSDLPSPDILAKKFSKRELAIASYNRKVRMGNRGIRIQRGIQAGVSGRTGQPPGA